MLLAEALRRPATVHVTKRYRRTIVNVKHPNIRTLGRWVCAVVRHEKDVEGFLITAYLTDAIKEGEKIWPR
jgi:hypothetical protein